ncbi:uncharacterized protein LOC104846635 isoform X1 [Loxodonta africana]|uniref:uncharacterized protein LOC104846635 isoform X1 n=1 Tax=Loxodonta africana TaxID=9785 RepID=UPI0030D2731B
MADTLISDPQPPELMFTVTRALEEALFQHFICQKLEIAYAIHKPIPFFEDLRDKFFITERIYKHLSPPAADQSFSRLMSGLRGWFLSCAIRSSGEHCLWDSSSRIHIIRYGLFMRIWGLYPIGLLLPQELSVVLPSRADIDCGRAPTSSFGLRIM